MLVLTRGAGERIRIGDDIVITVTKVCGGRARIGIDAPPGVEIMRCEVDERRERENAEPILCSHCRTPTGPIDGHLSNGRWLCGPCCYALEAKADADREQRKEDVRDFGDWMKGR